MSTVLGVGWIVLVLVAAVGADVLPLADPNAVDAKSALQPPSSDHWLGTDGLGRDQLSRLVHGAQVSMTVSVAAVAIGVFVGGLLGLTAGYLRGRFEGLVLGVSDVVLAFPGLVLLLVLLAYVGRSLVAISVIIGILSIPLYARVARANTLSVTEHEYVRAASVLGATRLLGVFREVLPNIVLPLTAYAFVALGRVIVLEGSLAFLGLSVKPPDPTWGQMIADSKRHISDTLWPLIPAASAMFFTVLALSLIGDRLRRTIDVRGEDA
ncbi:MAG: ABC transporter permease [Planctomycetes bacterium]|nr:ABC transporter permease [Planctomycetota bacterium]